MGEGGEHREADNRKPWIDVSKESRLYLPLHYPCTGSKTEEKEQTSEESWRNTSYSSVFAKYSSRCQFGRKLLAITSVPFVLP